MAETKNWFATTTAMFWICFATTNSYAQDKYSFNHKQRVTLKRNFGGNYSFDTVLPDLPLDQVGKISLLIHNPFDEDILIGESFSGCGCLKISLNDSVIRAGEKIVATLELKTPKHCDKQRVEVSFRVALADSQSDIACSLKYSIAGLVAFQQNLIVHEVNDQMDKFSVQIPLIINPPTSPRDVQIHCTQDLEEMDVNLRHQAGSIYAVEISTTATHPLLSNLTGDIVAVAGDIQDSTLLVLKPHRPVSIAPSPLRFSKTAEGSFATRAIVRVKSGHNHGQNGKSRSPASLLSVRCNIGDENLEVTSNLTQLSAEVFRIEFQCDSPSQTNYETETEQQPQLQLRFHAGDKSYDLSVPVTFN